MSVVITEGTFLYFDGRRVRPITGADGPQDFDPALERRLVEEDRVAEWYAPADPTAPAPEPGPGHVEVEDTGAGKPLDLADMTRAELADLAVTYGIRPGRLTKAKLIEAIREADETAPDLDAAEVE